MLSLTKKMMRVAHQKSGEIVCKYRPAITWKRKREVRKQTFLCTQLAGQFPNTQAG